MLLRTAKHVERVREKSVLDNDSTIPEKYLIYSGVTGETINIYNVWKCRLDWTSSGQVRQAGYGGYGDKVSGFTKQKTY